MNNEFWDIHFIANQDNQRIRYGIYQKDKNQVPQQALILINGRTEFLEKYFYVADDLNLGDNWVIISFDHKGQGVTTEQLAHIDHYKEYAKDLKQVVETIIPGIPYHFLAHSMGGLIALWSTLKGYVRPVSLHLSSPLLGVYHPFLSQNFMYGLARTSCALGFSRSYVIAHKPLSTNFENNPLTKNRAKYDLIVNAPYPILPITYGWLKATIEAIWDLEDTQSWEKLKGIKFAITYSNKDTVVDFKATQILVEKMRSAHIPVDDLAINGLHELLSEEKTIYRETLERVKKYLTSFK